MQKTKEEMMEIFIKDYNILFNVPNYGIDRNICEQYKREHPNEFKSSGWSIGKHRKKKINGLVLKTKPRNKKNCWVNKKKGSDKSLFLNRNFDRASANQDRKSLDNIIQKQCIQ